VLEIELPLGKGEKGPMALAAAGIGAAVALPMFFARAAKAPTTSAATTAPALPGGGEGGYIALLAANAQRHHTEYKKFPPSVRMTPAGKPGRDRAAAKGFEHKTWKALAFAPGDTVLYRYEFRSGKAKKQKGCAGEWFEVVVTGDVDGDGVLSTWTQRGVVDAACQVVLAPLRVERGEE
jgi:hypothetical protein